MSWREQAMCRGYDPDLFFPHIRRAGGNETRSQELADHIAAAKRVCAMCPVDLECLDYALQTQNANHMTHHQCIWGGTTYQERLHIAGAVA